MTTDRQLKKEDARRARNVNTPGPPRILPPGELTYNKGKLFPDGYPVAVLEGYRIPTDNEIKRVMAGRCAYLIEIIEKRARLGQPNEHALMEVAAIARLIDLLKGRLK